MLPLKYVTVEKWHGRKMCNTQIEFTNIVVNITYSLGVNIMYYINRRS